MEATRETGGEGRWEKWNERKKERKKEAVAMDFAERESNTEGQQSHSGSCSMRERPVTPCLICVQSALRHTQASAELPHSAPRKIVTSLCS